MAKKPNKKGQKMSLAEFLAGRADERPAVGQAPTFGGSRGSAGTSPQLHQSTPRPHWRDTAKQGLQIDLGGSESFGVTSTPAGTSVLRHSFSDHHGMSVVWFHSWAIMVCFGFCVFAFHQSLLRSFSPKVHIALPNRTEHSSLWDIVWER